MAVCITGKNIYIQFIDDAAGKTLISASTVQKDVEGRDGLKANMASAQTMGKLAAERAKAAGIDKVVFDRAGARYHGKLKALADAAREGGLQF